MRGSADRADRAQPDRRVDVLEGASIVAFAAVQGATTQTAMPVLRIEADRNVKVSDRSVELPPDLVDRGPTHIDIRVAGGLFEGDVELLDRATIVALADVCVRPVEDGERAGRTGTDRGVEILALAGLLRLAEVPGSLTQGGRRGSEEQSQNDRENQHSPLAECR